jgi:hypothetical protein
MWNFCRLLCLLACYAGVVVAIITEADTALFVLALVALQATLPFNVERMVLYVKTKYKSESVKTIEDHLTGLIVLSFLFYVLLFIRHVEHRPVLINGSTGKAIFVCFLLTLVEVRRGFHQLLKAS